MIFFTPEQCRHWAAEHSLHFDWTPPYADLQTRGFTSFKFEIPSDAGRRVALARLLWESVAQGQPEVLIWTVDWSVWPSGEHMPLAMSLRSALGEVRGIDEAPGQLIRLGEDSAGISLLSIAILFLWDTYLLPVGGETALFVSHDEYGVLLTRSPEGSLPVQRRLAIFQESAA